MIPVGNIMPGDTCPWVSLRSTHGYRSDHPSGDATHHALLPRRAQRGRASTRPYTACMDNH
ncbi:MAG: hypothetical protein K2G49_00660 [Muribaculum sp.]|nr:hypothetical protein [Muribaculum sp.]